MSKRDREKPESIHPAQQPGESHRFEALLEAYKKHAEELRGIEDRQSKTIALVIHQRRVEIPGERCLDEAILCDRLAGLRGIPLASLVRELNSRGYQTELARVSPPDARSPLF